MRRAWGIQISIGLLLSSSLLVGCGGRNSPPAPSLAPETSAPDNGESVAAPTPNPDDSEAPATATATSGNGTAINPPKSARLKAQQSDAQINLRSQPTTASESQGYGLVGDAVKLLRAAEGSGGLTWYYVKFDESGAEGWIRGDFIDTSGASANANLNQGANVSIDSFTTDEIFAVGSGGCGMTLWPVGNSDEYIFFNGLPDTGMWMKLDGTMTKFRRTAASGPEFYGQSASQTFVSQDGAIAVDVTASVGSEAGYESVNIQQGRLVLEGPSGGTTEITVAGDAGC